MKKNLNHIKKYVLLDTLIHCLFLNLIGIVVAFPGFLKNENIITEIDIKKLIISNKKRWRIKYLHEFLGSSDNYDFIIRFENYKEDYYKMLEKFNLDKEKFKIKHINNENSNEKYKSLFLNDECKKVIKNYSYKYCEIFNYKCEI